MTMDAFLGSWKIQAERTEGPSREVIQNMAIPEQYVDMFVKAVYTVTAEKVGDDKYQYTFVMDGAPQKHVAGPFKLGETFEFYDPFCKRTEQITITFDGGKSTEVTKIKEDASVEWTVVRYLQGEEMVAEATAKGKTSKSYLKKL